jgi:myo-inositol-hexaphosphate 3-phosphohydrolase
MYLAIRSTRDEETLQSDLQKLGEWERKWQMEFHPGKCQVLSITRNRRVIKYDYTLHGNKLEHVSTAKYLGITLSHDLRWNQHITNITNKANRTLGFLRRNLQINHPQLKTTAYNSLVRPSVEYATTVWDPYTKGNIRKVEMVQRRAARFTLNRY